MNGRLVAPQPPLPLMLLLMLSLPVIALAASPTRSSSAPSSGHQQVQHAGYEDDGEQEIKDVDSGDGHSLVFDLSSLSVLAALKIKFVVVALIAVAVVVLLTKGFNTKCLFGNCRPNYSTYGYYPYVDYTYVGYEVPAGSAAYRRPASTIMASPSPVVGVGAKDSHHLSDLTARVWNSIDIAGMAFSALNIQEDDCRRKLVCQADRAAASNPLLRAALSWFSASLARYRTDRSRLGEDREDPGDGGGVEWRQQEQDPCEELFPRCLHRDLPPALGGPARPHIYLDHQPHHHHHHHHPHHHPHIVQHGEPEILTLAEPLADPWGNTDFHPVYRYEYPSPGAPADALYPSVTSLTFPDGVVATPVEAPPPANPYAAVLASAAASPSAATVLAPAANASTTASSSGDLAAPAGVSGTESPPEPRSPGTPGSPPSTGGATRVSVIGSGARVPLAPLVWRRVLFGGNSTKEHND